MKRLNFLFLAFFVLIPASGEAQLVRSYGLKIGMTSAKQNFEGFPISNNDVKRRIGLDIGIYLELFDTSFFSLISRVMYSEEQLVLAQS